MLKRMAVVSSIVFATLLAGPVGAQLRTPDSHFYGGFGLGRSDSNQGGLIDNKDSAWKAFGGYQLNKYFAVEGGYIDLGAASAPGVSFDSNAWHASAVGSLPMTDQFALTGKLGLARTTTDFSTGGSDHNTDPTYGLGLRFDVNRQIGIRGEWERYRVSGGPFAGRSDTDVFSINAIYRFR